MPVFTSSIELSDDYPSIQPSLNLNFAGSRALDPHITFARDSVGTYVDKNGLIKTAGEDEARFDHDPETLESLGLLIEESRTNKRTYSAAPNASNNYRIYGTPTYNTTDVVAPDGTTTATKIVGDGIVPAGFDNYSNNYGGDQGIVQTYSVYVKNINATSVIIRIITGIEYTFTFATETGVLTGGSNDGGGFQKLPNGWYRVWLTDSKPNGYWYHQVMIDAAAVTSNSMYFWGVQLEVGSFPTSYIPTSAAAVTRAVDTATITGTSFSDFYNQNEGTLVSFSRTLGVDLYQTATFEFTSSNVNAELIGLEVTNSYNRFYVYGGGASASNYNYSVVSAGTLTKNALAYKLNDVAGVRDGGTVFNDTSAGIPIPNIDRATIGYNFGYGNQKQQHIDRLLYYPKRLTDAQLQLLTS